MRIALGADHAGVALKDDIKQLLDERGIAYTDFGTNRPIGRLPGLRRHGRARGRRGRVRPRPPLLRLGHRHGHRGQQGARHPRRADRRRSSARLSREHNDANVLALGERLDAAGRRRTDRRRVSRHAVRRRPASAPRRQDLSRLARDRHDDSSSTLTSIPKSPPPSATKSAAPGGGPRAHRVRELRQPRPCSRRPAR